MADVTVRINQAELDRLFAPSGPVADYLADVAEVGTQAATRHAPVRTGHLRSLIHHEAGHDGQTPYEDIISGADYALWQEVGTRRQRGTPHLRPGLEEAMQWAQSHGR